MNAPAARPPADAPSRPSLDEGALARLRELDPDGRHGVVRRVLDAYAASLARTLQQLHAQPDPPHPDTLRTLAHTLKSSSASVGALELATLCAEVEQGLRDGVAGELGAERARLVAACERAQQAVEAMLQP